MRPVLRPMALCALTLLAGCSIDFDRFLRGRAGSDAGVTADLGTPPVDTGAPPVDTGAPPVDTGTPPVDTGTPPVDVGTPPVDVGMPPRDTGVVGPAPCRAPYLVAVAENLDANAARVLRWSFADDRRCDDLALAIAHPRAIGVAFESTSDLMGPQLIVANDEAVTVVDASNGATVRDVPAAGSPRSIFDIVANGQGTFAVAYTFAGGSLPGSVGNVRVFDHRSNNLREVQAWNRNQQFGLSVLAMTAFPGNQGQYLTAKPADTGSGTAVFVTSPTGTGFHTATMPALMAGRANVQGVTAYRTVDRRGHFAVPLSGGGGAPGVYVASIAASGSTLSEPYSRIVLCSDACPAVTRAVAFPDENDQAAGICEVTGTQYTVVRFGGASSNCAMLDTAALGGRWRINDLAVMPR